MTRRILISLACTGLITAGVAACGSTTRGPLTTITVGGQPNFSVDGGSANPGQPDVFGVWVINKAHEPVTLVSGSLIAVSGHPTGRLVGLGVSIDRGNLLVGGHGWPVPSDPMRPYHGARLPHGYNTVLFGMAGDHGAYMVAGVHVIYRYHGQLYSMDAWSATTNCVQVSRAACKSAEQIARRATEHMAGVSS